MKLSVLLPLSNLEVWPAAKPVCEVTEVLAPSEEGLRLPDALMRVDVGLKGIKSIYKIALEGAASIRTAVAIPATPKSKKVGFRLRNYEFQQT